jgi:hypothetical protein
LTTLGSETYARAMRLVSGKRHGSADDLQHRRVAAGGILYLAVVVLLSTAGDAAAYLDPGTGSIVLQALIGGAMAAAYFFRKHWQTLRSRIGGRRKDGDRDSSEIR